MLIQDQYSTLNTLFNPNFRINSFLMVSEPYGSDLEIWYLFSTYHHLLYITCDGPVIGRMTQTISMEQLQTMFQMFQTLNKTIVTTENSRVCVSERLTYNNYTKWCKLMHIAIIEGDLNTSLTRLHHKLTRNTHNGLNKTPWWKLG